MEFNEMFKKKVTCEKHKERTSYSEPCKVKKLSFLFIFFIAGERIIVLIITKGISAIWNVNSLLQY